ncbi:hypothetical protein [Photobacterium piscicola]|uniref:hypothetical protein n=1 Tax=Photobacterium piscicola TaxID=1378299 RepID=UPI003735B8AF
MLETIKFLNLGEWAISVVAAIAIWKWILKGLAEKWFQNRLDLQKQEVNTALQIQKDLALQQAEFEKVKLERVLPILEQFNGAIFEHKMMYNTYVSLIINKGGILPDFESKRVKLDEEVIESLASIAIYLPPEFRGLVYQLRKAVSCSWRDPLQTYYLLLEKGGIKCVVDVCAPSNDLYSDLVDCFYDMCNKYLGISNHEQTYASLLKCHGFIDCEFLEPTNLNAAQNFVWKYILFHEYFGINEHAEVLGLIEQEYKAESVV